VSWVSRFSKRFSKYFLNWIFKFSLALCVCVSGVAYGDGSPCPDSTKGDLSCTSTDSGFCPTTTPFPADGQQFCQTNLPNTCTLTSGCTYGSCTPSGLITKTYTLTCLNNAGTYAWAKNFLIDFLDPFYTVIVVTTRVIGILLIFNGVMRLRRGAAQNMMQRLSPMATVFYFIVGAIFCSFMPDLLAFSNGFFGAAGVDSSGAYTGSNHDLTYACSSAGPAYNAGIPLADRVNCPVLGYLNDITSTPADQDNAAQTLMQVVYAILLVVGLISFLRGCLFLLKLGEGNSQENSVQKAVVHIVAGMIGMNAEMFQGLVAGVLPGGVIPTT